MRTTGRCRVAVWTPYSMRRSGSVILNFFSLFFCLLIELWLELTMVGSILLFCSAPQGPAEDVVIDDTDYIIMSVSCGDVGGETPITYGTLEPTTTFTHA